MDPRVVRFGYPARSELLAEESRCLLRQSNEQHATDVAIEPMDGG